MGLPSGTSEECSVERDRMGTGEDGSGGRALAEDLIWNPRTYVQGIRCLLKTSEDTGHACAALTDVQENTHARAP